jgi:hypothetical protein
VAMTMREQRIRAAVPMRTWGTITASRLWLNRFLARADTALAFSQIFKERMTKTCRKRPGNLTRNTDG